jgi:carboxypeptidase C (cathepsin A)
MRFFGRVVVCLLSASLFTSAALARGDDDKKKDDNKPAEKAAEKAATSEVTTQGSVEAGGQHILYNAIAGTITVGATDVQDAQLGLDGKPEAGSQLALNEPKELKDAPPTARMSYFAYFKRDAKPEDRPITFFYNGGPGSSTVWLHMGSLGPKHVVTVGDKHLPAAPYKMVDNANSLLDVSDLVFIDMPEPGSGG